MEEEKSKAALQRQWFCESLREELHTGEVFFVMKYLQGQETLCYDLFRVLTGETEYAAYSILLCSKELSKPMQKKYEEMSGVSVVEYGSHEFVSALATAETIMSNTMLPSYYIRREGQAYVDIPGNSRERSISQLLNATCLLSKGPSYTETVYEQQYRLRGLYKGIILEQGTQSEKAYVKEVVKVVLYHETRQAKGLISWGACGKGQLLFVLSVEKEGALVLEQYKAIINQLIEEGYEVTLLIPGRESDALKARLAGLKRKVHIIWRIGKISVESEAEAQILKMQEAFAESDQIEEVMKLHPAAYLSMEWRRMLGETVFDCAYLISPQSVFWYAMFLEVTSGSVCLLQERTYKNKNNYRVGIYYDRVIAMNLATYQAILDSGELEERKMELFDTQYCLLRSNARFFSVFLSGTEYLECSLMPESIGMQQAVYIKAPEISRISYFLSITMLSSHEQTEVIEAALEFLKKEETAELYVEASELDPIEEERLIFVPQQAVSVELLERLDLLMSVTTGVDYKYCYIAALIKKPYGSINITGKVREQIRKETKELLESRGMYCDGRKEARYLQYQKEEMQKLLY